MREIYSKWPKHLSLVCLVFLLTGSSLRAQLMLERELIGAAAAISTVVPNGGSQQLQVDASFGETMIGYAEGDIIITVGFHQPESSIFERQLGDIVESDEDDENDDAVASVNAYPNPTLERLNIDLGPMRDKIIELRLIDVYGRTVKYRAVNEDETIIFTQLDKLPNANYFLQGVDREGKLHHLSTVMIVTY